LLLCREADRGQLGESNLVNIQRKCNWHIEEIHSSRLHHHLGTLFTNIGPDGTIVDLDDRCVGEAKQIGRLNVSVLLLVLLKRTWTSFCGDFKFESLRNSDRGKIVFGNAQTLIAKAQIHPNWRNYLYVYAIPGASRMIQCQIRYSFSANSSTSNF
jgi:hypothetical protein